MEGGSAERLLAAAETLLAEEGFEALSMRRLAARVGLSQAAIYRHFRDKAELVDRLVAKGYAEILALIEASLGEAEGPAEALAAAIRAYVDFARREAPLFRALLLQDIGPSARATALLGEGGLPRRRSFAALAALLERGMAEGCFEEADLELTAKALWASIFGLAARVAVEGMEAGPALHALVERQIDMLLRGLEPRGEAKGRT